jgi:hypothetical protein
MYFSKTYFHRHQEEAAFRFSGRKTLRAAASSKYEFPNRYVDTFPTWDMEHPIRRLGGPNMTNKRYNILKLFQLQADGPIRMQSRVNMKNKSCSLGNSYLMFSFNLPKFDLWVLWKWRVSPRGPTQERAPGGASYRDILPPGIINTEGHRNGSLAVSVHYHILTWWNTFL